LLTLSAVIVATACSSGNKEGGSASSTSPSGSPANSATSAASKTPDKKVKLRFAAYNQDTPAIKQDLANFAKAHPSIEVEVMNFPNDLNEYYKALDVAIAGNETIDVILLEKDTAGKKATQGILTDLDSIAQKDNNFDIKANYGSVMDGAKTNGKYYYIPYNIDFDVLYYNKDMFDAKGIPTYPNENMTLSQLAATAKKLATGEGANKVYGFVWGYTTYNSLLRLIENEGWQWLKEDGTPNLEDPRVKGVFATFKDLFDSGAVPSIANMQLEKMNNRVVFAQKHAAMIIRNWWTPVQWSTLRYDDKLFWQNGPDFKFAATHLPRFNDQDKPKLQFVQPGWGYGVSAKSKNPAEAWEFIKFMTATRYEVADNITVIPAYTKISDAKFATIYNYFQKKDGTVVKDAFGPEVAAQHKKIKDEIVPTISQFQIRPIDVGIQNAIKDVIEREATEYFTGKTDIDAFIKKIQSESVKVAKK